jgi:hypothetical protein
MLAISISTPTPATMMLGFSSRSNIGSITAPFQSAGCTFGIATIYMETI